MLKISYWKTKKEEIMERRTVQETAKYKPMHIRVVNLLLIKKEGWKRWKEERDKNLPSKNQAILMLRIPYR